MRKELMPRFLATLTLVGCLVLSICSPATAADPSIYSVGVAKVDITPNYPVRLNGYYARTGESEGVAQRIFAKAMAIGKEGEPPAVVVSVDNCGVPAHVRNSALQRLQKKGVTTERFAVCSTHTHSAPKLAGNLDTIFAKDIPAAEQAHIDRYTQELTDKIVTAALTALKKRKPAKLFFGQTTAGFAINRRVPGGPVDHDVPVLHVTDLKGRTRAILLNYACHCTTLSSTFNKISGDWAGYTQEFLEKAHPDAVALTLIGCGAECNPAKREAADQAAAHGRELADAVERLLSATLQPLTKSIQCQLKQFPIPFDTLPTRAEFEARARNDDIPGYHARKNLARLDRGEKLPTELPYSIQVWSFGEQLALMFLPGEVVGDYALRLKREFDPSRLWVNAYANDVPCYIPSRRVWKFGSYETVSSMHVYDQPTRLSPNTEDIIFTAVHDVMPKQFLAKPAKKADAEKQKQIYLLMGQSNMVGSAPTESQDRMAHPRVLTFTKSNHWELAIDPLHGVTAPHGVGPGLSFGKAMAAVDTNVIIGLVPCAVGATLLQRWERGGDLYSNALARAKAAMAEGTLKGILWHQGEQDSILETNAQSYYDRISRMIPNFREDLGQPDLPFVVGQIGEFLYTRKKQQTPFAKMVNDALLKVPDNVPRTACVRAAGLTHKGDEVHFDAKSQRELGKRYAAEMKKLQANSKQASTTFSLEPGFVGLFDEKTLNGWHFAERPGGYLVTNGVLICTRQGKDLMTDREFANFELRLEYKLLRAGNNGIAIRASTGTNELDSGINEIQILDDDAPIHANLEPSQYNGSLYKVFAAKRGFARPPGEWNALAITADGGKIKVILNGTVITDGNLKDLDEKFLTRHPWLKRTKGPLGFLGHRTQVEFRHIRIREL